MADRLRWVRRLLLGSSSLLLVTAVFSAGCQQASVADAGMPAPTYQPTLVQVPPPPLPEDRTPLIEIDPVDSAPPALPPEPMTSDIPRQPLVVIPRPAPQQRKYAAAEPGIPAAWIPHVPARPWKWIVIHHTATSFGNEAIVNRWHIDRGFDEMGYHFLIGNGTNSGDGQVEVGSRWPKQKWGAHTKTPDNRFNDFGIGICLVGNFDVTRPTAAQMRSLDKLVAFLMKTYHIPLDHVLGHGDCKSTDCPGKNLSVATVRQQVRQILADEGENVEEPQQASSDELMHDVNASN